MDNEPVLQFHELTNPTEVWGIIKQCSDQLAEQGLQHWKEYYTEELIEKKFETGKFIGVFDNSVLAGVVHISTMQPKFYTKNGDGDNGSDVNYLDKFTQVDSGVYYITALAISPESQGKGLAEKLIRHIESQSEVKALRLDARYSGMEWLTKFYTKMGFKKVGEIPDGGEVYFLMEKVLS